MVNLVVYVVLGADGKGEEAREDEQEVEYGQGHGCDCTTQRELRSMTWGSYIDCRDTGDVTLISGKWKNGDLESIYEIGQRTECLQHYLADFCFVISATFD